MRNYITLKFNEILKIYIRVQWRNFSCNGKSELTLPKETSPWYEFMVFFFPRTSKEKRQYHLINGKFSQGVLTTAPRRRQERTHVSRWRKGESEWGWWKLLWLGRRLGKCSCYDVKLSANGCTIRSTSTKVTKQQLFTAKWSIVKTCSIHCDSFCFLSLFVVFGLSIFS